MVTHVSFNSSGYMLIETSSADVASWAGDDRLVARFLENRIDKNTLGTLIVRAWEEGDEKRIRSRLHYSEKTHSWHTSLRCPLDSLVGPFGKTVIPNEKIRISEGQLKIDLPRLLTPLIKKTRRAHPEPTTSPLWEHRLSPDIVSTPRDYGIGSSYLPGLSRLIEEAGEVIQAGGKILGLGSMGSHWDGDGPLDALLENEIGDFFAAAEFFTKHNGLSRHAIRSRAAEKLETFERWHRNIQEGRDPYDDGEDRSS